VFIHVAAANRHEQQDRAGERRRTLLRIHDRDIRHCPRAGQVEELAAIGCRGRVQNASFRGSTRSPTRIAGASSARRDDIRLAWLWRLIEPQLRRRLESRADRRIREARLPVRKTFEAFNLGFQRKLDKDVVMELATLRFVTQGKNVLLAGMSGTGKSHIALALALLACAANRHVLYTTSADMLAKLNMSLADDTLTQALKPYTRAELLVVDEVASSRSNVTRLPEVEQSHGYCTAGFRMSAPSGDQSPAWMNAAQ
jgi:chromosomal replication initiation ATPase DnaA